MAVERAVLVSTGGGRQRAGSSSAWSDCARGAPPTLCGCRTCSRRCCTDRHRGAAAPTGTGATASARAPFTGVSSHLRRRLRELAAANGFCYPRSPPRRTRRHEHAHVRGPPHGHSLRQGRQPLGGAARANAASRRTATRCSAAATPDFLYACGRYPDHHDAGEYAHWPPFQAAAALPARARRLERERVEQRDARLVAFASAPACTTSPTSCGRA